MASPWPGRARSTGRCGSPATPCCMTASARSPTAPGRHRPAPSRMRALPGHRAGALQHDRSGGRRAVRAGPPRAPSPSTTKAGAISAKTDPLSRVSSRRRQPTSAAASAGHPSARGLKSPVTKNRLEPSAPGYTRCCGMRPRRTAPTAPPMSLRTTVPWRHAERGSGGIDRSIRLTKSSLDRPVCSIQAA